MDLPIGDIESRGHSYNVQITARSPAGKGILVFDANAMGIADSFGPSYVNATIPQGEVWEIIIPLRRLTCVVDDKQGYTLRIPGSKRKISAPELVFQPTLTPAESARESREDDFPYPR